MKLEKLQCIVLHKSGQDQQYLLEWVDTHTQLVTNLAIYHFLACKGGYMELHLIFLPYVGEPAEKFSHIPAFKGAYRAIYFILSHAGQPIGHHPQESLSGIPFSFFFACKGGYKALPLIFLPVRECYRALHLIFLLVREAIGNYRATASHFSACEEAIGNCILFSPLEEHSLWHLMFPYTQGNPIGHNLAYS